MFLAQFECVAAGPNLMHIAISVFKRLAYMLVLLAQSKLN